MVRRRDGPRRLSDHDECIARVGQQFMAPLGPTRLNAHRGDEFVTKILSNDENQSIESNIYYIANGCFVTLFKYYAK